MRHAVHQKIADEGQLVVSHIGNLLTGVLEEYKKYFNLAYTAKVYLDDLGAYLAPETLARLSHNQHQLLRHGIIREAENILGGLEQQIQLLTTLRNAFLNAGAVSLDEINLRLRVLQGLEVTADDVQKAGLTSPEGPTAP